MPETPRYGQTRGGGRDHLVRAEAPMSRAHWSWCGRLLKFTGNLRVNDFICATCNSAKKANA